mmetsp:Transcript_29610/g.81331  ORF Transcript_29610/g.81331 Transcript_29610/m.81331 type:complete len:223 (+) Transcript_29610:438-1106(+)
MVPSVQHSSRPAGSLYAGGPASFSQYGGDHSASRLSGFTPSADMRSPAASAFNGSQRASVLSLGSLSTHSSQAATPGALGFDRPTQIEQPVVASRLAEALSLLASRPDKHAKAVRLLKDVDNVQPAAQWWSSKFRRMETLRPQSPAAFSIPAASCATPRTAPSSTTPTTLSSTSTSAAPRSSRPFTSGARAPHPPPTPHPAIPIGARGSAVGSHVRCEFRRN